MKNPQDYFFEKYLQKNLCNKKIVVPLQPEKM
jgi:hypothetical protein